MTRPEQIAFHPLPSFRHVLEAAIVFGAVGGLADVTFELARYFHSRYDILLSLRFANAGVLITALAFLVYLLVVLAILRPISRIRRWPIELSLTVLYFMGILLAGAFLCRGVALMVAQETALVVDLRRFYYFLAYLWLLIPLSWAIGSWLARFRTSHPFATIAGRFSGFAFAASAFLFVTLAIQNRSMVAKINIISEAVGGPENTIITMMAFFVAVMLFPIAAWISVLLARPVRGALLWLLWMVVFIGPFLPPILARPSTAPTQPSGAPLSGRASNVVIVSLDTVRYDDLGCFGSEIVDTPTIDAVAEQGICFDNAIAPMPLTGPSHMSIMTGFQPDSVIGHGVKSNGTPLSEDIPTLATILDAAGYRTGAVISGYPLSRGASRLERGFHYYQDILDESPVNRFLPHAIWDITTIRMARKVYRNLENLRPYPVKTADLVTDQALGWLEENSDQPFFLFVHYFDAHYPYEPPAPFDSMYMSDYDGPWKDKFYYYLRLLEEIPNFTEEDFEYFRAMYRGEISFLDSEFRRVIEWGEERDIWDNTLLIVVSDHGESFEHNYYFSHTDRVYESLVRAPLIIRDPDAVADGISGERVDTLVNLSDIFFTVLGFLNVNTPVDSSTVHAEIVNSNPEWDHNLLPLIRTRGGVSSTGWEWVASQSFDTTGGGDLSLGRFFSFRFHDRKLIYGPDAEPDLPVYQYYNLVDDPDEEVNLYSDPDIDEAILEAFTVLLTEWASNQAIGEAGPQTLQGLEALKALGYAQ